ncbi:hypothetical protein Y032_0414g1042 [Ancylostoma ceylanicum]|uniref:Uncharacterized protein n=1 Tax=Ancylostoma ceylanicum TaxID=53326 RepID=A0A016X2X7_9BILA|nr:hypothetical protein Y032_0414g1042 [Ancylostoma ceylanicum]
MHTVTLRESSTKRNRYRIRNQHLKYAPSTSTLVRNKLKLALVQSGAKWKICVVANVLSGDVCEVLPW